MSLADVRHMTSGILTSGNTLIDLVNYLVFVGGIIKTETCGPGPSANMTSKKLLSLGVSS